MMLKMYGLSCQKVSHVSPPKRLDAHGPAAPATPAYGDFAIAMDLDKRQ